MQVVKRGISLLEKHFDLKILGRTRQLLGVEFEEKYKDIFIHQGMYTSDICRRFDEYLVPFPHFP
ncbi:unnamed protein product [Larinioides sclopetarius]|uniref:Uncharacterized protein n=1 Tax=Larinioides sclopetarius TaxID=280406 RepID=A0AAV2BZU5_9ARAC